MTPRTNVMSFLRLGA